MGNYDEYQVFGLKPGQQEGPGFTVARFDGYTFEGSNEYNCFWLYEKPRNFPGWERWDQVVYGPHVHKCPEVVYLLGSNCEDPFDLGATVEFRMGPEMEAFSLAKSCLIYIPAGMPHGFWQIKEVRKPFIVFNVHQSPIHTEKALREMVPEDLRQALYFVDQGYDGRERVEQRPDRFGAAPALPPGAPRSGKYDKYILTGLRPGERDSTGRSIAHIDDTDFEGANEYWAHWAYDQPLNIPGMKNWWDITHGPHKHKFPEVVAILGSDPDHPEVLGMEFWAGMGPEMEMTLGSRTNVGFLPPHFIHGPSTVKKVTRPLIFIECNQSPIHTEKAMFELVPGQAERDKMMWTDIGYEPQERKVVWPKGLGYK